MKDLNQIIRNAVCTVLNALNNYEKSAVAAQFADFNLHMIPKYLESPKLLDDHVEMWDRTAPGSEADES